MEKKEFNLYISKSEYNLKEIEELRNDFEKMEEIIQVFTPDLNWFEQKIEITKRATRKKLIRDLAIFWLLAIIIITLTIMIINQMPIIYIVLQITALLSFLISSSFVRRRKRVERQ